MFARLWWKEARQTWPVWAFLAVVGIAIQALIVGYAQGDGEPRGLAILAEVVTLIYVFLIAAAVFAGERESSTLWILDALPVERLRLWAAKASFAFATALGLGGLLLISALALGGYSTYWRDISGVALLVGLVAMGWGLFWSSLLANAMTAAVLAMVSLSVTLLALVNLQTESGAIDAAPLLLLVAALSTAASAWIFRRFGPPRWEPRRARPAVTAGEVEGPVSNILLDTPPPAGRLARVWKYSVPRLLWETLRQVRSEMWTLIGLAIASGVGPFLLFWNTRGGGADTSLIYLGSAILALTTGVLAFNGENRGQTQRFLLQHGARPGVVWAVKVGTWWLTALGLWAITFAPIVSTTTSHSIANNPPFLRDLASIAMWVVAGLTIIFAIGVLCGMAFRRGIMAGMIALVASLATALLLVGMLASQIMFPWYWPYLAVALLAVGWAWSADWLYDRPGWGRWARLAVYAAAVPAILGPAYIASRAWGAPLIPASQYDSIFQQSRIVAPVADEDNAAPLYREAERILARNGYPASVPEGKAAPWITDVRSLDQASFDPIPREVLEWLGRIEPALVKLREAARKPACRFQDLRKASTLDVADEPPLHPLITALAVSARVRLAQGEMEGAWTEVESLERMARQYSYSSRWSSRLIDPLASGMALRWTVDPRQTAATLEKAARAWKALPEATSPADRIRADAALFHNMLDLPGDSLVDLLLYGPNLDRKKAKVGSLDKLRYDVQTTSWERARARRVYDLLAAAQIRRFEGEASPFRSAGGGIPSERWRWIRAGVDPHREFVLLDHGKTQTFTPDDLNTLSISTPLLDYSELGRDFDVIGRNETTRRAVWLVLLLRLYQTRHDGKLPTSLDAITAKEDSDELGAKPQDLVDVFSSKPFGYVPSQGQSLLPIGSIDPLASNHLATADHRQQSTEGCMLLYSVGPDETDDRAERNVGYDGRGDFVFPIKNDVKPPAS
ncbi:hypothetical protein [Paludisphaera rhizosphaerae]|uniref:hypothetical protein n=1 Tax=Paludisphaera rhizosphaerae TaxID=2711216 RepID=UPI0013EA3244|nr:hypothetical protein [Paludisphaera rhizosphaerae]